MTSGVNEKASGMDVQAPIAVRMSFLFLDENLCRPCGGTGQALDEAARIVAAPLAAIGATLEIDRIHVSTLESAIAHRLTTSPTLRINGADIDPDPKEGACGDCGEIAGGRTTVHCRVWRWRGADHVAAPVGLIVEAILAAATRPAETAAVCDAPARSEAEYAPPENLVGFFQARDAGERLCC